MPLTNARLTEAQLRDFCVIDRESRGLLEMAVDKLGMSARAHQRILKVARTIADLEGCDTLSPSHVAEAIQYRTLDRTLV
jgi:magnesium chelatase family protein